MQCVCGISGVLRLAATQVHVRTLEGLAIYIGVVGTITTVTLREFLAVLSFCIAKE
jgi:hypothetical protein